MITKNTNKIIKFLDLDSKKSLFFFAILFYGIFFLPIILYAYFYCDDKVLIYSVFTDVKLYGKSFLEVCYESFKSFLDAGRFYGLYLTHHIIYYFFNDRLSYYIVKSIFNLISVASFAWLLKIITKNSDNYKAFIFFMPILFLSSIAVDPLTSQGLSTQYAAISIALASGFYILWHDNKNKKYFFLSWIFFIWSFFHYEIGICIVPIFIVLATRFRIQSQDSTANFNSLKNIKKYLLLSIQVCFKELRFFLLPFLIWVLICFYLRSHNGIGYDGIDFSFNIVGFFLTWIFQICASFPFGFFHEDLYWHKPELHEIYWASILFILAYFLFSKLIPKINLKNNYRDIVLIGLILILVPSGIVSLSIKYQIWILSYENKTAFVQVFLQFFGVGFLLIAYMSYILNNSRLYASQRRQKIIIHFFVLICSISVALVNIFNYKIIPKKNIISAQTHIELFVKAIKNNVLQDFPTEEKVGEKFYNISKYSIPFYDFFEDDANKKIPEIKKDYKDLNVFYSIVPGFFTSHFLSYHNKTNALLILNYFNEKNIEFFKKNIKLENFYYADSWLYDVNIKNNNKKNLIGFIIAGKLDRIGYACDNIKSKSGQNCYKILNVVAPKIFIDKEYLFNLVTIITTLNTAFGENIFKDSFEQIEENLKNSKDGILIKLDNKIYKIKRP
jgi:hypothetical protein